MKLYEYEKRNTRSSDRVFLIICVIISLFIVNMNAQEDTIEVREIKPVKNIFESIWLIDAQTVMVPIKGTFEAEFQHRFGTWDNGYDDFYGIFAPSNIRIGVDYVPVNRLLVGLGFTKFNNLWDVYGKYALLRQMKGGGSPVSLDYYVNAAVDTRREDENLNFEEGTDRWSFFHQVMVARKISDKLSLQLSGNLSWFNRKDVFDSNGEYLGIDQNEHFSASVLARYKLSNSLGVIVEFDQPITSDQELLDPEPNLSFGLELVTSSHAFQFFVGNYGSLVPQYNHSFNANNFGDNQILIGFNITRLWNF
ncbi:MAG: DUF5777 family beta-barrel protein [Saprospiraceae bacterium]